VDQSQKLTVLELFCVFFWFMFDGFWLMEWMWPTYICSFISFSLAVKIFFYIDRTPLSILIAVVDTMWLSMNICWIVGDFSGTQWLISVAKVSFWLGATIFTLALLLSKSGQSLSLVLRRLRVLRFFR